ncbi:DUF1460 domain-containing protein [Nocardia aurantiaca]|uniref:DUF1460 domain-containing protein n=1 Tax=Nocardia aurantiaca TaxID=2675850 RepID=A0A6I3KZ84_9NOCA|nr:DUF1460 domain-containing protein [Nocardia aurantiaca]MTE16023.1 DUF1460 domain-containing protein [Nocardia aurantiaca]
MRTVTRILLTLVTLVSALALLASQATATPADPNLDETTSRQLDELLALRNSISGPRTDAIAQLSGHFLGTPYGANMLIGSATRPEQLVIDFRRVDCFTYLDYVEALSRSTTRADFIQNLVATRYADGRVEFPRRKHFFTDWAAVNRVAATDITATLTPAAVTVTKHLNAKGDGTTYLPGLPVVDRDITYVPSGSFDNAVIGNLHTGDYLGAYTTEAGLDVSHVGIFISTPNGPMFRNASSLSANDQVVDTPLTRYLTTVPGLVVLRPN